MPGISVLEEYADGQSENDRRAIREDLAVLRVEWDQYLRTEGSGSRSLAGFMSSMALGTTGRANKNGVALLTVHSSKGLEFDEVIVPFASAIHYQSDMDRRMLYIACTRAMHKLTLTYEGERSGLLVSPAN